MKGKMPALLLWGGIIIIAFVVLILHPRINYGLIFMTSLGILIFLLFSKKEMNRDKLWKIAINGFVVILLLLSIGSICAVFFPFRASYEYKNDIQELKAENPPGYAHFPNRIPEGATNVEWICGPGFMQGSSYERLAFSADEPYISSVVKKYKAHYPSYQYSEEDLGWINKADNDLTAFPQLSDILDTDKRNTCVILTTENTDLENSRICGMCYNLNMKYICFFRY